MENSHIYLVVGIVVLILIFMFMFMNSSSEHNSVHHVDTLLREKLGY